MFIFSYGDSTVSVEPGEPFAYENAQESICALLASALILLHREGALDDLVLFDAIDFLGELPSDERISVFLTHKLRGFIWTEMP